ncbi:hypothetical protein GCM10009111_23780 [Colwellia asteriadis]|uniref:Malonyl-CoA:ACP transacylase (MAT) domain-containing protein n=1 Tax=Colwellia asteriadis TaxID=517723 RepID=A0ABP3WHP2_9GAMM
MIDNRLAIIGIDSHFGQYENIDQVARALYLAKVENTTEQNHTAFNLGEHNLAKCVAKSVARMIAPCHFPTNNVANIEEQLVTIVVCESPACETAVGECITAQHLNSFTEKSATANTISVVSELAQALTLSATLIEQGKIVALVGINFNVNQTINEKIPTNTVSFDSHFNGYQTTSGLAAVLLCSERLAITEKFAIYSWINGVKSLISKAVSANDINQIAEQALQQSGVTTSNIGLLESSALAQQDLKNAELQGLCQLYCSGDKQNALSTALSTAMTSARSIVGEGAGFSQVLGLVRTVIALQQRYIPAISDWQSPLDTQLPWFEQSSFYLATEARPWYPNVNGDCHSAAYSCLTEHSYCHLILTEHSLALETDVAAGVVADKFPLADVRKNGFIASSPMKLILVCGESQQVLIQNLQQVTTQVANLAKASLTFSPSAELTLLAKQQYQYFLQCNAAEQNKVFTIALLCESIPELQKELSLAQLGMENAFESGIDWKTPKGSYFSAQPVTQSVIQSPTQHSRVNSTVPLGANNRKGDTSQVGNNIAFIYPGIGATYVGLGRDLFHLFPEIYQSVAALADDISSSLKDRLLNPRTIIRPTFNELKQLDIQLRGSLADIAEAGVGFACVFTQIFERVFKVKADFATGYSMGEVSMYAALGCWQQPGLMSARLAQSSTFNHKLCGELSTLRECWDLSNDEIAQQPLWETYTIKATLAEFEQASVGEKRVYCTIVNTPDSLLVGGFPQDCLRVIKNLGVRAMPLTMANAIHSAPAKAEYDAMVELYTMAVNPRIATKMYSSSCYLPVPQFSGSIANSIAKCLCEQVDFPRLVNTLYEQGSRVFIEMGPGRSLSSWVDKILPHGSHPHLSVPVNAKGTRDEVTYFRALAKLLSHGVSVDLESVFNGSMIINHKNQHPN